MDKMAQAVSKDFSNATDLADYLVRKGLPFRQAHEVVGKCVAYAIHQGKFPPEISLDEYKQFSDLFESDLLVALKPEHCRSTNCMAALLSPKNEKQFAIGDKVLAVQQAKLEELQSKL